MGTAAGQIEMQRRWNSTELKEMNCEAPGDQRVSGPQYSVDKNDSAAERLAIVHRESALDTRC